MSEADNNELLLFIDEESLDLKELRQLPLAQTLKTDWKQQKNEPHDILQSKIGYSIMDQGDSVCSGSSFWRHNFVPPWDKCNPDLIDACENGKNPLESHRREMVRIFADAILRLERNPRLKDIESVASEIVKKYPVFMDKITGSQEESIVPGGYITVSRWLQNRIGNMKRGIKCDPELKAIIRSRSKTTTVSNWAWEFMPPWDKCHPELIEACENGMRPWEPHRREMVRIFADAILRAEERPKMKDIELVAKSIVKKYPVFKDHGGRNRPTNDRKCRVTGEHSTMYYWLHNRIGNIARIRKATKMENGANYSLMKRRRKSDEYGCQNYAPSVNEVHIKLMEASRNWLVEEFKKCDQNITQVLLTMEQTYALQRNYINDNATIEHLRAAWPFLFQSDHLFLHYEKLVGKKDVKKVLLENLEEGGLYLFRAMKELCNERDVLLCVGMIEGECRVQRSDEAKLSGHLDLLSAYFKEPVSALYKCVESDTVDVDDSILLDLPAWPFLIVYGSTMSSALEYSIYIEKNKVVTCDSVGEALCYMFCSYYVFNIKYPNDNVATLEFIQRHFAKIDVLKSKTEKFSRSPVNPKVLKLTRFLSYWESNE